MKEARYSLTQEQLNDLAVIAADRAVEAYRSEEQKTQKRKDNKNVRITKKKLQSYGDTGTGTIADSLRVGSYSEGETSISYTTGQQTNLQVDDPCGRMD